MRVCVGVRGVWLVWGLFVVCCCGLGWVGVAWGGVGFAPASVSSFGPPAPGGFVLPVGLGVDNSAGASRGDVAMCWSRALAAVSCIDLARRLPSKEN
jgi:hypothetical protein